MQTRSIEVVERSDVISGVWKFSKNVTHDELVTYCEELLAEQPRMYLAMAIRGVNKDSALGIDFRRCLGGSGEGAHNGFFYRITDQLKRRFGNDFIGWDVSSPTTIFNIQ